MKHFSALTLFFITLLGTSPAYAEKAPETFVKNVGNERYAGGEEVNMNMQANGDITLVGGNLTINAPVKGSLQAAGGTVTVADTVQGNVRIGGGTVTIAKNIAGNLVVAGGEVHINPGVIIGGSVLMLAGDVTMDGTITGNMEVRGGTVMQNGTVRGNTEIHAQDYTLNGIILGNAVIAAQSFSTGPTASISQNLRYWSADGEKDLTLFVGGTTRYDENLSIKEAPKHGGEAMIGAMFAAVTFYSILTAALMIGLLLACTKTFFRDSAKYLRTHPGKSFLTGLIYFLLSPLVIILLIITIIGIPLAIALAMLYAISIMFAKVLSALVLARWVENHYKKKWGTIAIFFVSLGVFAGLKLLDFIPVVGWIAVIALVMMGYGAVLQGKYDRFKKVM